MRVLAVEDDPPIRMVRVPRLRRLPRFPAGSGLALRNEIQATQAVRPSPRDRSAKIRAHPRPTPPAAPALPDLLGRAFAWPPLNLRSVGEI